MKKGTKNLPPPCYSIPFLSVLHQNKSLHNFCKRGQRSIVEHNIGPEYALTSPYIKLALYIYQKTREQTNRKGTKGIIKINLPI